MDRVVTARDYYEALDSHDYERLSGLLAHEFCHERPNRTIDGRERFVQFMREERPQMETSHPIYGVFQRSAPENADDSSTVRRRPEGHAQVAVEGRLLDSSDEVITGFVDVFSFDADGTIDGIRTYSD